jgi:hypothetical protein
MGTAEIAKNKVFCHDCKKEIKIKGKAIENGVMAVYESGDGKLKVFKCRDCFEKSQELKNISPAKFIQELSVI